MTEAQSQQILARLDALARSVQELREDMASQRALRQRADVDNRDHEDRLRELEKLGPLTQAVEVLERNAITREQRIVELETWRAKLWGIWLAGNGASAFVAWVLTHLGVLP